MTTSIVQDIKAQFENQNDNPSETKLHINGITETKSKVPPPVPIKTKRPSKGEGPSSPVTPPGQSTKQSVSIEVTDEVDSTQPICQQDVVATLKQEMEEMEKKLSLAREELKTSNKANRRLQRRLDRYETTTKARRAQDILKKWNTPQPSVPDLHRVLTPEELSDAQQLIQQFVESERLYLNTLETIDLYFYQPLKMMAVYKGDIISTQQIEAIFLNSPQLVVLHRMLYAQLIHLRYLPKDALMEEFLIILEKVVPSLSLYCGFQAEYFMQNLQKELSQCNSKPQVRVLLEHLQDKCDGKSLADLMRVAANRLSDYISFLTPFLEERVKGTRSVNENVIKRIQAIIRYLTSLQVEQMDDKSDWECIVDKVKVLNRLSPDGPIPLEIFSPETKFIKQGPVIIKEKEKGKEVHKICFLFTTHIALADKTQNHYVILTEDAMMSLAGATLYGNVDMAGHIIQPDIHSGLEQDMLGFRINFFNQDHILIKVGRPNEKKQWMENIEKILDSINKSEADLDNDLIVPDVSPKIAAASLEKLFQHLTNPQIAYREDFIEVFLNTYPCFTTSKDILTALVNCIRSPKEKTPDPTSSVQIAPNHVFTFNMDDTIDTVSHSTSMTSMSASLSQNFSSGSDDSDFMDSPETPRKSIVANQDMPTQEKPHPSISSFVNRTSMSTDSDSSPYTSGVPIADGNKKEALNGWQDPSGGPPCSKRNADTSRQQNDSGYVTFFRPLSRESGNFGDTEDDETDYSEPRPSLGFDVVDSDELAHSLNSLDLKMKELQNQTVLDAVVMSTGDSKTAHIRRFSEMNEGLDEAQQMLFALQKPVVSQDNSLDDCFDPKEDIENFQKYTGRTRRSTETTTNRLSSSSTLSMSEPDLLALSVDGKKPSATATLHPPNMAEDELLTSLPATIARKFTDASPSHMPSQSPSRRSRFSLGVTKSKKTAPLEKSRNKSFASGQRLSVNPSSSLYFGSPEPQLKSNTSPSRGAFGGLFKKKEKKGLNKSMSSVDGFSDASRKGVKLNRAPSLGASRPNYVNIDEYPPSPLRCSRERSEDGSPRLKRKSSQNMRNVSAKIFAVLSKWIETRIEDFVDDDELMRLVEDFLQTQTDQNLLDPRLAEETQDILKFKHSQAKNKGFPCFGNLLARVTTLDSTMLEDIDWDKPAKVILNKDLDLARQSKDSGFHKVVAEQITLTTFSYYNAILRSELLNCNWKKKDKESHAPNICKLILRTNELTSWICTEVLSKETVVARASVIDLFICVAWQCYKHNDMHNALSIAVALSSTCIKRLSKSWDALDRKVRQKYEKLKDATDHHEKCKKLRERLENVTAAAIEKTGQIPPALPYLGAYLELIYTLDIGIKTYNDDGLVNFAKMTKLSSLIDTVLQYQQQRFNFQPRIDVIAYITSAKRLSENELYDLSVAREPSKR